jgi:hypothetical protein
MVEYDTKGERRVDVMRPSTAQDADLFSPKGAWTHWNPYRTLHLNERFPGGERRLIQKPVGLHSTLVNGVATF